MKKNKFIIIIILICSQFLLFSFSFGDVLKIGNENARITVKVFSSLTCPHCASFHEKNILMKTQLNLNIMLFH